MKKLIIVGNGGFATEVAAWVADMADVDSDLGVVFVDIETFASMCRFADCALVSEPGCAIRNAVDCGEIDARRLKNYQKLLRENERNSASLAEKRSRGRDLSKTIKQAKFIKQDQGSKN